MSARAYVLLNVVRGEVVEAVQTLRGRPGVIVADVIEGPPDIVMVIEARGRRRLADLTVEALSSVENITGDLQLLPVAANGRGYMPMTAVRVNKDKNGRRGQNLGR
jgi:hypothetical protein